MAQEEEALERARAEEEARGRIAGTKLSCRHGPRPCAEDSKGENNVSEYRPT